MHWAIINNYFAKRQNEFTFSPNYNIFILWRICRNPICYRVNCYKILNNYLARQVAAKRLSLHIILFLSGCIRERLDRSIASGWFSISVNYLCTVISNFIHVAFWENANRTGFFCWWLYIVNKKNLKKNYDCKILANSLIITTFQALHALHWLI